MAMNRFLGFLPLFLLMACGNYQGNALTQSDPSGLPSVEVADLSDLPYEPGVPHVEKIETASNRVFFAPDSDMLDADAINKLHSKVFELKKDDGALHPKEFILASRCQLGGSRQSDYALGYRRALAVKKFFMRSGVPGDVIRISSCVKNKPFAPIEGQNVLAFNGSVDLHICLPDGRCIDNAT